eukprot:gnl/MRDRNA2_/MRDRNA2_73744_c0_seq1.p1 gnl/MRDRNA2_/MRDRNA2_73744_c0~~gnl/MRDRNA2_/MRDRNA2_73744_c0_seq1.p1  ORF type:complete len:104 (-),score=4.44 gnl/MRDRNA2_/MRDRNA2_73744_c0_seq1:84-395(-)
MPSRNASRLLEHPMIQFNAVATLTESKTSAPTRAMTARTPFVLRYAKSSSPISLYYREKPFASENEVRGAEEARRTIHPLLCTEVVTHLPVLVGAGLRPLYNL